jgi:hypothetical protein
MANRYPLIVDTTDNNKIKELPSGDNLQLTGNSIIGVTDITASGTIGAGSLSATSIKKGGTELATVAVTGSFNDLSNRPTQLSDLNDDLNVLVPGDNIGLLLNNAGYLTEADLENITLNINSTGNLVGSVFANDSTLMIDGVLAAFNLDSTIRTNVVPAADGVFDLGNANNQFKDLYLNGSVQGSIDFTNATVTGLQTTPDSDVTGSVFADDSTLLVDGVNGKIVGEVDTLVGSIISLGSVNFDVENISARNQFGVNIGAGGFNNLIVLEN